MVSAMPKKPAVRDFESYESELRELRDSLRLILSLCRESDRWQAVESIRRAAEAALSERE